MPLSIRNAPTKLMKELGYGDNYKYAHDFQGNFADHEFLPEEVAGKTIYTPAKNQREDVIRTFLQGRWKDKYGY